MIKSESLSLKAQCTRGEFGMLMDVFGTTPFTVSTHKKPRRPATKTTPLSLYNISSKTLYRLDLPTRTSHSLKKRALG